MVTMDRRTETGADGAHRPANADGTGSGATDGHIDRMGRTSGVAPEGAEAEALAADLRARVRGEVRFDPGSRALYSTDASKYRQIPIGVVVPRDEGDVVETLAVCRRYGAPVLPRGGGTSLAGQCCNVAVVLDCSKYLNQIVEVDPDGKRARVQPGVYLDDLRNEAERHHLTFAPDPATHTHCTLGGMIGNNSCGVHSVMGGKTSDNVEALDIVTYDGLRLRVGPTSDDELQRIIAAGGRQGSIYAKLKRLRDTYADEIRTRFPRIPRRVSGYGLEHLLPENGFHVARALVGTEGTCVFVLGADLRLVHSPPARVLLVLGYPDVYAAGDDVADLMRLQSSGLIGLEGFDNRLVEDCKRLGLHQEQAAMLPPGGGWLLLEFGAETPDEASDQAHRAMEQIKQGGKDGDAPQMKLFERREDQEGIWKVREAGLGVTARVPHQPDTWEGWEDSAVPPEKVGDYLRDLRHLMDRYGYHCSFYGHFGQGCIHTRVDFDLASHEGLVKFRGFIEDAADLVIHYGGSISGEHGDGQSRAELLPKMFGPELMQAFREFKGIWDPEGKMNPGKVVDPYRLDQNIKLGEHYRPPALKTFFQFPEEQGSFAHATLRCVGVGKCRREGGGTMCPSYMVTREEQHSTRGRARMLFEMLQGDVITGGWRDQHVKDALDLCLACKGCKGDCPVHTDMATYKAEFLAHYYAGRLRPRSAYSMGLIYWWARLASRAPTVANFLTQTPLLRSVSKKVVGVAPQRQMPKFARTTFKRWFEQRGAPPAAPGGVSGGADQRVILWADTFNNHFFPEVGRAAVEVLEAAGYRVVVPQASLCCGRPLYDYGFLSQAKGLLQQILRALGPEIDAGVPVVGLEPSCVAVFRDELLNLFPHDQRARRLSEQTFLLDEFLDQQAKEYRPPALHRRAVVHGHCHQKALMGMSATEHVLERLGVEYEVLDSGCCGMAGSFGFEPGDHYAVAIKAGERVLLPAVRRAAPETLVIADGFSCREQIMQTTHRRPLHLAQVLQMAHMAQQEANGGPRSWAS